MWVRILTRLCSSTSHTMSFDGFYALCYGLPCASWEFSSYRMHLIFFLHFNPLMCFNALFTPFCFSTAHIMNNSCDAGVSKISYEAKGKKCKGLPRGISYLGKGVHSPRRAVVRNLKLRICQHFFSSDRRVHLRHASCLFCITRAHLRDSISFAQLFFPLYSSNGVWSQSRLRFHEFNLNLKTM